MPYLYLIDDDGNFITDDDGNKIIVGFYNNQMVFPDLLNIDASADKFAFLKNDNSSPWSLQVDVSAVTGGTPTYDIMVSNKSGLASDMVPYRTEMTGVALNAIVSDSFLGFAYIGIQYHAAGASGTATFYFQQNAVKTVLY